MAGVGPVSSQLLCDIPFVRVPGFGGFGSTRVDVHQPLADKAMTCAVRDTENRDLVRQLVDYPSDELGALRPGDRPEILVDQPIEVRIRIAAAIVSGKRVLGERDLRAVEHREGTGS